MTPCRRASSTSVTSLTLGGWASKKTATNAGRPREENAEPAEREGERMSVLGVPASVQPLVDGVVSVGLLVFFVVLLIRVSRKKHDPPGDDSKSKDSDPHSPRQI